MICLFGFSCTDRDEATPEVTFLLDQLFSESGVDHDFSVGYDVLRDVTPGNTFMERSLFFTTEDILSNDTLRGVSDAFVIYLNGTEDEINFLDAELANNRNVEVTFFDELDLQSNSTQQGFIVLQDGHLNLQITNSGTASLLIELILPDGSERVFRWSGTLQPANTFF
jgi:hypothetical protein